MSDLISRQAAIDVLKNRWKKTRNYEGIGDDIAEECELYLKQVPSAQPEPAIPLSWIENEIKWLKSLDSTFSEITALQISAMVLKWRGEQHEDN